MCSRQKPSVAPAGVSPLGPVSNFLGVWRGHGNGVYPTIDPFEYSEELSFETVGKPFMIMTQKTKSPHSGEPMHAETGYINVRPDSNVTMTACDPTGLAHVYEGKVEVDGDGSTTIALNSSSFSRTSWAKEVSGVRRVLTVNADGNKMEYRLDMAAVAQPMQLHLEATLHRVSQRGDLVITVDGAKQDRDSVMFLDIREGSEKESVPPIPGCMEVPMERLLKSLGDKLSPETQSLVEAAASYGKVIVVCGSGKRAQTVVDRLRRVCRARVISPRIVVDQHLMIASRTEPLAFCSEENITNAYALEGGITAWNNDFNGDAC